MGDVCISTRGLTRRFGEVLAVDHLDLLVPRGCVYGFLGPNGAGKTTSIRMLLGLIRPDEGGIEILGRDPYRHRADLLRRTGALVEAPSLYPHLTGRENLELLRQLRGGRKQQVDAALDGLALRADANRCVREYSLGMRQRLGLALALFDDPELLILDEPTNGLDPAGIQEIRELLRRVAAHRGTTVFLSSHLLSEVEQSADHVGIVHRGKLCWQGSLQRLQEQRQKQLLIEADQPAQAATLLEQAGWNAAVTALRQLRVSGVSPDDVARINRLLVQHGVAVFQLELRRPSLEATFLRLTGAARAEEMGA